jgi:hypothetical protein
MIQLSVERIPRRVVVAVAILVLGAAITNAANPYADRIKIGADYCENVIQSSIQNYATTIIQWALKNYTSGKAVNDVFQAPPLRFSLNLRGNSISDLDPLRDHLDDPCELPQTQGESRRVQPQASP